MNDSKEKPVNSALELEKIFAISKAVSQAKHWKIAMDQVVPLLRAIFIYDNLVLYLLDDTSQVLEVAYARVVGRGRSAGPELTWGEAVAQQVFNSGQISLQTPQTETTDGERLNFAYLLGVPVNARDHIIGAVVFIRFGGPPYSPENLDIASYIAEQIGHLVEHDLLAQEVEILEAERQQARLQEDFISTISHELLTPLGFIKGYTTTLLRADASWNADIQKEFLSIVDEETDRLQELIDNLLDSARLQSGTLHMQFQPVRLDALLKDVIMRAKVHNDSLEVITNLTSPGTPIQGDPTRLAQIFENLLSNVIKYAPGSTVLVTLQPEQDQVHISFQDNGPGIPAKYLPHIFERFFRDPEQARNVRGTGLGLYICKQIIDAHHGNISVESVVGEGTTFHIFLPFQQSKIISSDPEHPAREG